MQRKQLPDILYTILTKLEGSATMMQVFKYFWKNYGKDLSPEEDIFYTWNYDLRWAATQLRKEGKMRQAARRENTHGQPTSPHGIWELELDDTAH